MQAYVQAGKAIQGLIITPLYGIIKSGKLLKSFKYRIYPTPKQEAQIEHHFGCCRLVWNLALSAKIHAYQSQRIFLSRMELQRQLVLLKSENCWLYDVNSQSLQSVLLHLDNAYNNFLKGKGYPKFKKKSGRQSFQCPQKVRLDNNALWFPKIKTIKTALSRPITGKIKTVTISRTATGKYFSSILVETEYSKPRLPSIRTETTIGMDLGIKSFAVSSDGKSFEANRKLKNNIQRLKCLSRRVSRKKKGSNNRKRAVKCLAILHERITNQRSDYIHKTTSSLVKGDNQTFVIEDLNVAGMLKNRKLSQAVSDVGFYEFRRQMTYKCEWYGKNLIIIDRFEPTSKKCSCCEAINETMTLADREWVCANCGSLHDRDLNAAVNIKNAGLKKYSGMGSPGEPVESSSIDEAKKREV